MKISNAEYALFHNGKQISKAHSSKLAAEIEAYERRVINAARGMQFLQDGYEIKEIAV